MDNIITILTLLLTPVSTIVSYMVGRRKRDNDFLQQLQSSIDLLSKENSQLLVELIELKRKNIDLEAIQARMAIRQNELMQENGILRTKIEDLEQEIKQLLPL